MASESEILRLIRRDADLAELLELENHPDSEAQRLRVATALSLDIAPVPTLLERLHDRVRHTEPDYVFTDESGEYESLFGPWLPSRNPFWSR